MNSSTFDGVHVLTNCTVTKSVPPLVRGNLIPSSETMAELLNAWSQMVNEHKAVLTPGQIFRGLSMQSLQKIAEYVEPTRIHIVSGGQGLRSLLDPIVPYDFTTDPKQPDYVGLRLLSEQFIMSQWWTMINALWHGEPHPIGSILESGSTRLVLCTFYPRFMRFLPDDILSSDPAKLRIIMTSTSRSSIPMQLRPYILQYDRRIASQQVGNRNDLNQRAGLHFIRLLAEQPDMVEAPAEVQQAAINIALQKLSGRSGYSSASPEVGVQAKTHYQEVLATYFASAPSVLALTPDQAYAHFRRTHSSSGGVGLFRAAYFRAKGVTLVPSNSSSGNLEAARKALETVGVVKVSGKSASWSADQRVLEDIALMVSLLREQSNGAGPVNVTSVSVFEWLKAYRLAVAVPLPPHLVSATQMAHFLSTYAGYLGFEQLSTPGSGRRIYTI